MTGHLIKIICRIWQEDELNNKKIKQNRKNNQHICYKMEEERTNDHNFFHIMFTDDKNNEIMLYLIIKLFHIIEDFILYWINKIF